MEKTLGQIFNDATTEEEMDYSIEDDDHATTDVE